MAGDNLDVLRSRPDQCVVEPGSHCFVVVIDVVCSGEGGWVIMPIHAWNIQPRGHGCSLELAAPSGGRGIHKVRAEILERKQELDTEYLVAYKQTQPKRS